ncbi:MAG TPA: VOC family protein [Actinomycetota bacterium]|nr:VOC family protein [Actinomycetota bacterium]
MSGPGLEQLDFLYIPSRDVASDVTYFRDVLGGRVVFAIESMGTRVAAVELGTGTPLLLFADHLDGEAPVLAYRVGQLDDALAALETRGWKRESTFEIPHGPCCSFRTPGGHRIAVYQPTRPDATAHFEGRRDF